MKRFNLFYEYIYEIILIGINSEDIIKIKSLKPLIKKFIKYPNTQITEVLNQNFTSKTKLIKYFEYFLIPYIKRHQEYLQLVIEYYQYDISNYIQLIYLFTLNINEYEITSLEISSLYNQLDDDLDKDLTLFIWSKSIQNGNFDEMFINLMDNINVHISIHIQNIFNNFKIPLGVNIELIAEKLENKINEYINQPTIIIFLWKFLRNNMLSFKNFMKRFWSLIITQITYLKFYIKKNKFQQVVDIIEIFTYIFTNNKLPNNQDHIIPYFSDLIIYSIQIFDENFESQKYYLLIKSLIKLTLTFESQLNTTKKFFDLFIEYYEKIDRIHQNLSKTKGKSQKILNQIKSYQCLFESFIHFIPKMIKYSITLPKTFKYQQIYNILIQIAHKTKTYSHPIALICLYYLGKSNHCLKKIKLLHENAKKGEFELIFFPFFWNISIFSDLKNKFLISYIIQKTNNEINDQIYQFILNSCYQIIFLNPTNQIIQKLFFEIDISKNSNYCKTLLYNTFISNPQKTSILFTYLNKILINPKFSEFIPININEKTLNFSLPNITKLIFCNKKKSSPYLTDFIQVNIETLINETKLINGNCIPLSIYFHQFLPDEITYEKVLLIVKNLRNISYYINELETKFEVINETQINDLYSGEIYFTKKQFLHPFELYLHHGMTYHSLISAKEKISLICKNDLMKLQRYENLFPHFDQEFICSNNITNYEQTIKNAINYLPSKQLIPFTESFAYYFLVMKYIKVIKSLNKNKNITFDTQLSHFYSPETHKSYLELRNSCYTLFKIKPKSELETIHMKNYMKSLHQNFIENRPQLSSADELLSKDNDVINYTQIVLCFYKEINNKNWRNIFENIVIKALRKCPNNNLFICLLYSLLKNKSFDFNDCLGKIPFNWTFIFMKLNNKNINCLLPKTFYISNEFSSLLNSLKNKLLTNNNSKNFCGNVNIKNSLAPLLKYNENILYILPFAKIISNSKISFSVITNNGRKVTYVLTTEKVSKLTFSSLEYCLDSLLKNFVDTHRRNQRIGVIHSIEIEKGLWLTQTDFKPFGKINIQHNSKKIAINWNTMLAYRYASLCTLQIMLNGQPFNKKSLMFEKKSVIFSISNIKRERQKKANLYLADKISDNMGKVLLFGPFCSGIISSSLCFSYQKEKVDFYLKMLLKYSENEIEETNSTITNFSISDNPVEKVYEQVAELIKNSTTGKETDFTSFF